jgi:murein DD-endopeptidase MepM/ murein hydrolase activator NlpD
MATSTRVRLLILIIIGFALVASAVWAINRRKQQPPSPAVSVTPTATPAASATPVEAASPLVSPSVASPAPSPPAVEQPSPPAGIPPSFVGSLKLIVPVAGVQPQQLTDTFGDSRSEGRVHDAIDIPAAPGTPVLAAAAGEIIRLFQSEKGGTTIYQLSNDRKMIFYYAHLQGYAAGLTEGRVVQQGEVIAYVGDTGNAGPGNYHLHFSIAVVSDPNRYWEGTNINPYPLLKP